MAGLRVGRALDINRAREVADKCVDSILRNDDALLLLTKLKHKDEYTAEHSLNVSILSAAFGKRLGSMLLTTTTNAWMAGGTPAAWWITRPPITQK